MPSVLVYRDTLFAPSESFIERMYCGFERLTPLYAGTSIDRRADRPTTQAPLLIGNGPGSWFFKQFGRVPQSVIDRARAADTRLVHAQFGRGGALALPLAEALGVPLVVTFHGGDATKDRHYRVRFPGPTIYQRRRERLNHQASLILCVSDFIRETLIARGFDEAKLVTHHLGIHPPQDAGQLPSPTTTTLLAVGRLVAKKGFDLAISAIAELRQSEPDVTLEIIGDGPLRGELIRQAEGLPVVFHGWLDGAEVASAMANSYALLAPSRRAPSGDSEGLPTVVLEAQMRGLPVIASRHAGIPEAVEDGQSGLLFDENNAAGLVQATRRLRQDQRLWYHLQRVAKERAQDDFDAATQSRRLEERLCQIIR